jgi:hypothetical protein
MVDTTRQPNRCHSANRGKPVSEYVGQRSTSTPTLRPGADDSATPLLVPITSGCTDTRSIGGSDTARVNMDTVSSSRPNIETSRSRSKGVWVSWRDFALLKSDHALCQSDLARFAEELTNCRAGLAALISENMALRNIQNSLAGATALQGRCQVSMTRVSSTLADIDRHGKK